VDNSKLFFIISNLIEYLLLENGDNLGLNAAYSAQILELLTIS